MTPLPAGPYPPNSELVAVQWLRQRVAGVDAGQVATALPRPTADGVIGWRDAGFVQVQALPGGAPDVDTPEWARPIVQVDCWGVNLSQSSLKPAWNKAQRLAELIRRATFEQAYGTAVTMPDDYLGARVQAVYLSTEPRRLLDDPSGYARVTLDLAVDWVPA